MASHEQTYTVAEGHIIWTNVTDDSSGTEQKAGKKVTGQPADLHWLVEDGTLIPEDPEAHAKALAPTKKRS